MFILILIYNFIDRSFSKKFVPPALNRYMFSAASYIFLFTQPDIFLSSLEYLNCVDVGGNSYILNDLNITCTEENKNYIRKRAIPILFFESFSPLPILFLLFYFFKKNKISKIAINPISK
jgi:hypothetical protein